MEEVVEEVMLVVVLVGGEGGQPGEWSPVAQQASAKAGVLMYHS